MAVTNKEIFETAPVSQAVAHFVVPALLSTIITILYNLADTIFIGMLGDPNQIAAMSVSFPVYQFLNAFGTLFGLGTNSVISRSLGEKKYERVGRASAIGFWGSLVFIIFVSCALNLFKRPLLIAVGATAGTLNYACDYLWWVFVIGGVPTMLSIIMCNLLRSEGQAKKASFGLMLGAVLNIILDPLFIFVFKMQVAGAACATMISNCVSLAYFLSVYFLKMKENSYINLNPFKYNVQWSIFKEIILVGLPSCSLTILGATGCFVQNHILSKYSEFAVAGFGITTKIAFIGINCTHGVAQGVLPLIGYNYGAKNYQRIHDVNRFAIKILAVISILLLASCQFFSHGFIRIFINNEETIEIGARMLRLYILCMPFMSFILLTSTLCQAVGKWQYSLGMLAIRQLLLNIPLMLLLDRFVLPMYGVPLGQPICDFICLFIAMFVYKKIFSKAMLLSKGTLSEPEESTSGSSGFRQLETRKNQGVMIMNEVKNFLTENPIFHIATLDGDQPRVRPFGFSMLHEGRIYFGTSNAMNVYKQLKANPYFEISAATPDRRWLRLKGKAVFDSTPAVKAKAYETRPALKNLFKEAEFELFYAAEGEAVICMGQDQQKTFSF